MLKQKEKEKLSFDLSLFCRMNTSHFLRDELRKDKIKLCIFQYIKPLWSIKSVADQGWIFDVVRFRRGTSGAASENQSITSRKVVTWVVEAATWRWTAQRAFWSIVFQPYYNKFVDLKRITDTDEKHLTKNIELGWSISFNEWQISRTSTMLDVHISGKSCAVVFCSPIRNSL